MKKFTAIRIFSAAVLASCSVAALADWNLVPAESAISFFSVKKDAIGENHQFLKFSGALDKTGHATLNIDLNSAETHVPIRNERLQTMLFETAQFPAATVSAVIDMGRLKGLSVGAVQSLDTELSIDLHGKQKTYAAKLQLVKLSGHKLLVTSVAPVVINAADFDLVAGIDKLKEVAALPAIATAVPVSVSLVFSDK